MKKRRYIAGPLQTEVTRHGQPYVDDPINVMPKEKPLLEEAIADAFSKDYRPRPQPITVGHERVQLNWIKPAQEKAND